MQQSRFSLNLCVDCTGALFFRSNCNNLSVSETARFDSGAAMNKKQQIAKPEARLLQSDASDSA
jgi:hypothetical protein